MDRSNRRAPEIEASNRPHRDAMIEADVRRLVRELRSLGPLSSRTLARRCHAERWDEGAFTEAVRAGLADGKLRALPFGFLAAPPREGEAEPLDRRSSAPTAARRRPR